LRDRTEYKDKDNSSTTVEQYWESFSLIAGTTRKQPGDEDSYAEEGPDEKWRRSGK
jgi:hypothetical protein